MERDNWQGTYDPDNIPSFPCPKCSTGQLLAKDLPVRFFEPKYSVDLREDDEWEPDWLTERFVVRFECSNKKCGEFSFMSGSTVFTEFHDHSGEIVYGTGLEVASFTPAPQIIKLPEKLPWNVHYAIREAFSVFWISNSVCANRIRASIEILLDDFGISRTGISSKTGKSYEIDLNGRIALLEKQNAENAETLTALRIIGNVGSHSDSLRMHHVLDAFELYEDLLETLYDDKKNRLKSLKRKIIASKGKYY